MTGANAVPLQIGNRGDQRADSWRGLFDEACFFDNAVTDAEIAALTMPAAAAADGSGRAPVNAVPEATSMLLMASGLFVATLGWRLRRG